MAEHAPPRARAGLAAVAVPTEHGGWGLTAEPVLLGLLVAPSLAGGLLGLSAVAAFMARTPLRVVLVDRHRDRSLGRTQMAARVLAVEVLAIGALVGAAALVATDGFWWPVAVAAPLVAIELWYDTRSRSRRDCPRQRQKSCPIGPGAVRSDADAQAGQLRAVPGSRGRSN